MILTHTNLEVHSYQFNSPHTEVYPKEDYGQNGTLFRALLRYYLDENSFSDKFIFNHLQLTDCSGRHPLFSAGATVDLFGYSIGASLAELLMLSDPDNLFSDSRAFLFCGGSALDLSAPVSKTIIDGEAYRELLKFFDRLFGDIGSLGDHLLNLAGKCMREMEWFKSLLFIDRLKALREGRLRQIAHRIAAAVMRKDRVFSPEAVRTTLTGDKGDIPIRVSEHAPSWDYSHKSPFPDSAWESSEAYCVFDEIMESAGSMYCNV